MFPGLQSALASPQVLKSSSKLFSFKQNICHSSGYAQILRDNSLWYFRDGSWQSSVSATFITSDPLDWHLSSTQLHTMATTSSLTQPNRIPVSYLLSSSAHMFQKYQNYSVMLCDKTSYPKCNKSL